MNIGRKQAQIGVNNNWDAGDSEQKWGMLCHKICDFGYFLDKIEPSLIIVPKYPQISMKSLRQDNSLRK